MNAVTGERAVEAYVDEVRSLLAGLDGEEAADLTDSLASDLTDAARDADDGRPLDRELLVARFGTPESYARELCAAAGLPFEQAVAGSRPAPVRRVLPAIRRVRRWWSAHRPGWLAELAPVWWLLRGWLLFHVVVQIASAGRYFGSQNREVIPYSGLMRLALLAAVVVSVACGIASRRARDRGAFRWLSATATVVAVLAAVPVVSAVTGAAQESYWAMRNPRVEAVQVASGSSAGAPGDGVWVDGMQVSNLFAYDADGEPLTGVQLYDDRGRPVRTVSTSVDALQPYGLQLPGVPEPWTFYPSRDADGRARWNVFPLSGVPDSEVDYTTGVPEAGMLPPVDGAEVRQPPSPFAKAPAVMLLTQDQSPSDEAEGASSGTLSAAATPTS